MSSSPIKLLYRTDCFNISQAWSSRQEIEDRDRVLRLYQGLLVIPVLAVAFPLTLLYLVVTVRAIRAHRVSRKFHVLLVNRAAGDLSACVISALIVAYVFIAAHVDTHWIQFNNTLFTACFWSGLVTYSSIGFLKLYGIARPLQYKNKVTMRRCLSLIKMSWLIFLLVVIATMGFTLIVKIELLATWTGCKVESCLTWMYRVRNVFTILLYTATIGCFLVAVLLIKRAKRRSNALYAENTIRDRRPQRSTRKRYQFPLIKLTVGVCTFAVFHLPYALWNAALLLSNGCYFLRHYNLMQSLLGVIRLFVLLRIAIDAVLGFALDKELRYQLCHFLGIRRIVGLADTQSTRQMAIKLSTTTNSGVVLTESAPDKFDSVEEAKREKKRTESAKGAAGSTVRIQPKRHSDKT